MLQASAQQKKMYITDTGLFTTLLFNSADKLHTKIYAKLLSDKLEANLGYLYENAAAQVIEASGNKLFYHTWKKKDDVQASLYASFCFRGFVGENKYAIQN